MATTYDVELYVYDLSQGFAAMMSEPLLGKFPRKWPFSGVDFSNNCQVVMFSMGPNFRGINSFENWTFSDLKWPEF